LTKPDSHGFAKPVAIAFASANSEAVPKLGPRRPAHACADTDQRSQQSHADAVANSVTHAREMNPAF
ncbi:MAG: hypothetical protein JO117_05335, partial [Verrucomicrobia bacterium]|nr:hypothetical protein [Verrucomicrobiota bacterium]